MTLIATG